MDPWPSEGQKINKYKQYRFAISAVSAVTVLCAAAVEIRLPVLVLAGWPTHLKPCPQVTEHGDQALHELMAHTPLSSPRPEWSETGRGRPSHVSGASHNTCRHGQRHETPYDSI